MAGQRNAKADRDGKLHNAASPPQKRRQIVWQGILRTRDARARDEIQKTGRAGGDLRKSLVRGSRSAKEDGIEMVSGQDAPIVFRFFGRKVRGENAVSARRLRGGSEFFQAHLHAWIVVAEEDQRHLRGLPNPT